MSEVHTCCPLCGHEISGGPLWDAEDRIFAANGVAVTFTSTEARVVDLLWRRRPGGIVRDSALASLYENDPSGGPDRGIMSVWLWRIRKKLELTGYTVTMNIGGGGAPHRLIKMKEGK